MSNASLRDHHALYLDVTGSVGTSQEEVEAVAMLVFGLPTLHHPVRESGDQTFTECLLCKTVREMCVGSDPVPRDFDRPPRELPFPCGGWALPNQNWATLAKTPMK